MFIDEIVESIDTNQIGVYKVTYKVMSNGKLSSVVRTIKIGTSALSVEEIMTNEKAGENGSIRLDNNNNKRYAGSDPNNYVCFGMQGNTCDDNHLYRIIGVFDQGTKIIKNDFYSEAIAWDTNNSNDWETASLKLELNGTSFYENSDYIDEISRGYIANGSWGIGEVSSNRTLASYEDEENTSLSSGYVGLMSVVDFGYASNSINCDRSTNLTKSTSSCRSNNWLTSGYYKQWTMIPYSNVYAWGVSTSGEVNLDSTVNIFGVCPAMFLKQEVKIISGEGTSINPYILGM